MRTLQTTSFQWIRERLTQPFRRDSDRQPKIYGEVIILLTIPPTLHLLI